MRKVVQISIALMSGETMDSLGGGIVALCDDGTMWIKDTAIIDDWQQIPNVPQIQPRYETKR